MSLFCKCGCIKVNDRCRDSKCGYEKVSSIVDGKESTKVKKTYSKKAPKRLKMILKSSKDPNVIINQVVNILKKNKMEDTANEFEVGAFEKVYDIEMLLGHVKTYVDIVEC